jgi:inosine-uridine nucleoside N-ribohydrolase
MPLYPKIDLNLLRQHLELPQGPVSMVLDTDTYNEIDDQFAVVYSLISEGVNVEALYAAPFHNTRSNGPGDGMHRSYEEILRLLDRLDVSPKGLVYHGSERYLGGPDTPVRSDATDDLIARALQPRDGLLYVVAIGAITNVASAILLEPKIRERICVVWLGGHPQYWPHSREFNLQQDVPAAQVIFDSGVAAVQIPCKNVAEHLRTTLPEMAAYVKGRGAIGDYLYQIFEEYFTDHYARSKVLWDISGIAYLLETTWVPSEVRPSPVLRDDVTWGPEDASRHPFRVATDLNRDKIYGDLFRKLAARN